MEEQPNNNQENKSLVINMNDDNAHETFMNSWNDSIITPMMERRKKHLVKMNEFLNLIDHKNEISKNISNWLIENNKILFMDKFLEMVKNDLQQYIKLIDKIFDSKMLDNIENLEIDNEEEPNISWKEKIKKIEDKIKVDVSLSEP